MGNQSPSGWDRAKPHPRQSRVMKDESNKKNMIHESNPLKHDPVFRKMAEEGRRVIQFSSKRWLGGTKLKQVGQGR